MSSFFDLNQMIISAQEDVQSRIREREKTASVRGDHPDTGNRLADEALQLADLCEKLASGDLTEILKEAVNKAPAPGTGNTALNPADDETKPVTNTQKRTILGDKPKETGSKLEPGTNEHMSTTEVNPALQGIKGGRRKRAQDLSQLPLDEQLKQASEDPVLHALAFVAQAVQNGIEPTVEKLADFNHGFESEDIQEALQMLGVQDGSAGTEQEVQEPAVDAAASSADNPIEPNSLGSGEGDGGGIEAVAAADLKEGPAAGAETNANIPFLESNEAARAFSTRQARLVSKASTPAQLLGQSVTDREGEARRFVDTGSSGTLQQ